MQVEDNDIYCNQDKVLMLNYFILHAMFEDLPREDRVATISAIKKLLEPIEDKFNTPLTDEDYVFLAEMPISAIYNLCNDE